MSHYIWKAIQHIMGNYEEEMISELELAFLGSTDNDGSWCKINEEEWVVSNEDFWGIQNFRDI